MAFNSFKNILKDYFTFTNRERRAILFLLVLIILLLFFLYYLRFKTVTSQIDFTKFNKEIVEFEQRLYEDSVLLFKEKKTFNNEYKIATPTLPTTAISLFDFNPNNLPDTLWMRLGINKKTIQIIKNFEAKGGKFYKKEDLKKIYGMNEQDFKRLEPYIVIPQKISVTKTDSVYKKFNSVVKTALTFDLNRVSAEELKTIYGIGDGRASAIIKYRSKLGGYLMKQQLLEVFGMDTLYKHIETQLEVKTKNLRLININTAYETELIHPYISKQLAIILVNYRKMHGNFKRVDEIQKLPLVNDELYRKLAPYLTVE